MCGVINSSCCGYGLKKESVQVRRVCNDRNSMNLWSNKRRNESWIEHDPITRQSSHSMTCRSLTICIFVSLSLSLCISRVHVCAVTRAYNAVLISFMNIQTLIRAKTTDTLKIKRSTHVQLFFSPSFFT